MMNEQTAYYQAIRARDPRFDGVFFTGVLTTGIYCRPICPAKTPKLENCCFFNSAEAAEKAQFRPCLRCRPELAPGHAPVDDGQRIAHAIMDRIEAGILENNINLEDIAAQFQLSSRQIRRIVQQQLGVSPMDLVQTRRLLLAKQLLTETALPVTDIAFASGFASLRRFNDAFAKRYRMPPTHLRKEANQGRDLLPEDQKLALQLTYRPPYDWEGVLDFLRLRTLKGVEEVTDKVYRRTVQLGQHRGWIEIRHHPDKPVLQLSFPPQLTPVLPILLGRLRGVFDLRARPDLINECLSADARLQPSLQRVPGLRVPGAFDGFELAVRAILGQQVTVKAATTLAGRFTQRFGTNIETPHASLTHLSPTPDRVAGAAVGDIASLGIISTRANSILALAQAMDRGDLPLGPGMDPETTIGKLTKIQGIGPWTANYIAMRALRWPDAFPKEDVVIRKVLGGVTAKQAEVQSQAWRPWRAYAVLHLWHLSAL